MPTPPGSSPHPSPHRQLRDPRELQALAHPVRLAIIEQLSLAGPLTATELADRLDETPANCSWHLRKLAEHAFVEPAPAGPGRRRPWQVPGLGFSTDESDADPTERRAMRELDRMWLERHLDQFQDARDRAREELGDVWGDVVMADENAGWMTPTELREMRDEVAVVINRYHHRLTDPDARPAGSRPCRAIAWMHPLLVPGLDTDDPATGA